MVKFAACFTVLGDPREANARHDLLEILVIGFCTMLCGGEDCSDMAVFDRAKATFLRQLLRLPDGIWSHDTFSKVFRRLDPAYAPAFASCREVDGEHGRIETRDAVVCSAIDWLRAQHQTDPSHKIPDGCARYAKHAAQPLGLLLPPGAWGHRLRLSTDRISDPCLP